MPHNSEDDLPLLPTAASIEKFQYFQRKTSRSWKTVIALSISLFVNFVFVVYAISQRGRFNCPTDMNTPVQDIIEYVPKRFTSIWDKTIYNGPPSPELDEAWEDLYINGIVQLPKDQAARLPNRTAPIPGDEDNYIITLDVFHQLHCLNMVRQAMSPDYYNEEYYMKKGGHDPLKAKGGHDDFDHMGHCIDSIRESLTCSADSVPIVWTWDGDTQRNTPKLEVVHMCRNYENLQDWAITHKMRHHFNDAVHVQDDLVFPNDR